MAGVLRLLVGWWYLGHGCRCAYESRWRGLTRDDADTWFRGLVVVTGGYVRASSMLMDACTAVATKLIVPRYGTIRLLFALHFFFKVVDGVITHIVSNDLSHVVEDFLHRHFGVVDAVIADVAFWILWDVIESHPLGLHSLCRLLHLRSHHVEVVSTILLYVDWTGNRIYHKNLTS